jgi:hypothetical protein
MTTEVDVVASGLLKADGGLNLLLLAHRFMISLNVLGLKETSRWFKRLVPRWLNL